MNVDYIHLIHLTWVRLGPLGTAAINRPILPVLGDYDGGEIGWMTIVRGNRSTQRKPAAVPLCPPQTPHAAAVESQRLTAWATARPFNWLSTLRFLAPSKVKKMPWRDKSLLTFLTSNTTWQRYCEVLGKTIFKTVSGRGPIVTRTAQLHKESIYKATADASARVSKFCLPTECTAAHYDISCLQLTLVHIFNRLRNNLFNYTTCFDPNGSSSVFSVTKLNILLPVFPLLGNGTYSCRN
jgi:hypothetical protein